jgi:DNA-binding GntR family transcriptional regulator
MKLRESSPPIAAINQNGLSHQIYERLKTAILQGNFTLGQRLSPEELATYFQVSIMPIRDALRLLEADGLVEIVPRRGVFVTQISEDAVKEIFQVRQIIECAAVEELEQVPSGLLVQLEAILQEMENLLEGEIYREYLHYVQLDTQFHNLIVGIPKIKRLAQFYEELRWPLQLVLVLSHVKHQRAQHTLAEHKAILEALEAKDTSRAQAKILIHLNNARDDLLNHLASNVDRDPK